MGRIRLRRDGTGCTALILTLALTIAHPLQVAGQGVQNEATPQESQPRARNTAPLLRVIVLEGQGALNNISLQQGKDPTVRVEDDDGRSVAGATVTFMAPDMGPGATFGDRGTSLTVTTDSSGIASGRNLRPNNIAGQFQIRVTAVAGTRRATATITQTNAAPRRANKKNGKLAILILALAGGGGAAAALALRGGGQTATASPQTTGTVVVPGSPVFGPPR